MLQRPATKPDLQNNAPRHRELSRSEVGLSAKDRDRRTAAKSTTLRTLNATSRSIDENRCSPRKVAWWGRLLVAAFVAFYLNYIPIHLSTAGHLNDLLASVGAFNDHEHANEEHHNDADHHTPHPASDHALILTAQTHAPDPFALAVLYVLADTSVVIDAPERQQRIPVFERIKPPGESPPDPLQPRAPPLA